MGILTHVSREVDEESNVRRVYVVTKSGISQRSQLNRVAGRCTFQSGVGQRSLVAAAYDSEDIEMAWKRGPLDVIAPEEKYERAKQIEYMSQRIDTIDNTSDLFQMLTPRLQGRVKFGEFQSPDATLHVWEVPFSLTE